MRRGRFVGALRRRRDERTRRRRLLGRRRHLLGEQRRFRRDRPDRHVLHHRQHRGCDRGLGSGLDRRLGLLRRRRRRRRRMRLHARLVPLGDEPRLLLLGPQLIGAKLLGELRDPGLGCVRRPLQGGLVDAGRHHRDADDAFEALVEGRAHDDVGVLIHLLADAGRRLVDLVKGEVLAAGDRDQQAARALHRGVVDQRIGDRGFGGRERALLARGLAGAHHRLAHFTHDGANVGEVEIDQAFLHHQVGDAGDARNRAPGRPWRRHRRRWSSRSPPGTDSGSG